MDKSCITNVRASSTISQSSNINLQNNFEHQIIHLPPITSKVLLLAKGATTAGVVQYWLLFKLYGRKGMESFQKSLQTSTFKEFKDISMSLISLRI